MKKKLQKYLSGEREGFSLVELIIVIAIMAILIGVVALAVIPYLNRSRESRDLSTLDTVSSALTTAVAQSQVTGNGTFEYGNATAGDDSKVQKAMQTVLGTDVPTLTSNAASSAKIYCKYDTSTNTIVTFASTDGSKAVKSEYDNVTGYDENLAKTSGGTALAVGN